MLDDTTPDKELVREWQAGQSRERVFAILQGRYTPELGRSYRRMGFSDEIGEELIQETLLQAFRGLEKFRHQSSFRTWLHQIARNVARKWIRRRGAKKRTGREVPLDEVVDDQEEELAPRAKAGSGRENPLGQLVVDEQKRRVWAALRELPEAEQAMVRFRIWQQLSVRETARAMNKPEGTIKSSWSRILGKLKKKLGPHVSDLPL